MFFKDVGIKDSKHLYMVLYLNFINMNFISKIGAYIFSIVPLSKAYTFCYAMIFTK